MSLKVVRFPGIAFGGRWSLIHGNSGLPSCVICSVHLGSSHKEGDSWVHSRLGFYLVNGFYLINGWREGQGR